jgi:ABC-type polysaccharide/polyol phosphate export permease
MTYAAAGFFGGFAIAAPVLFWIYLAGLSFVAAAGGVAVGLYFDTFEHANFITSLLLTPALFLGGVFFDAVSAPSWLGLFARYNPLTSLVGEARRLFLGPVAPEAPITIALAGLLCLVAVTVAGHAVASGKGMKVV